MVVVLTSKVMVLNVKRQNYSDMTFKVSDFKMIIAGTITGVVCYIAAVLIMPFRYHDDSFF